VVLLVAVIGLLALGVVLGVRSGQLSGTASPALRAGNGPGAPGRTADVPMATSLAPFPGVTVSPSAAALAGAASPPTRLTIAAIGVNTPLQALSLLANGTLQSPSQWGIAGWYSDGVIPGQIGPAVIAGHIDSTAGPAVFYRLSQLTIGAPAVVTEQDGAVLTFVVDAMQSYPKDAFPAATVYGPTPYPELRLITCTGEFDRANHNYLSNLVVSAHLVSQGVT